MDSKQDFKNRIIILFVTLTLFHCISPSESFFLSKFMRRQATSPPQQQQQFSPLSSRGQQNVEPSQQQQYRLASNSNNYNRPPAFNSNQQGDNSNFQVPTALCLACERFPWTPVPGSQKPISSVTVIGVGGNENNLEESFRPEELPSSSEQKPQHYEVQIHKEKAYPDGTERPLTVVINDLGSNGQDGNRKPFAIQFDGAQSQNNFVLHKEAGYTSSINPSAQKHVPTSSYEQPRQPTLLQPVPQHQQQQRPIRPTQDVLVNAQYGQPSNQVQYSTDNRPFFPTQNQQDSIHGKPTLLQPVKSHPNSLNPGEAPTYFTNVNQYGPPVQQQQKHSYPKIPPINVGTIIAAQHNLKIHDIQPAKLVYQEHTHIYGAPSQPQPSYGPPKPQYGPAPPKPQYGPSPPQPQYGPSPPQQGYPQSYKVPIINSRPNGAGSLTINPIPLESVPNYAPPKPPGQYSGPPQSHYQQPTGYMQPPAPPPGQNYGQPKPNYAPAQQTHVPNQPGYLPPPPPPQIYNQPPPNIHNQHRQPRPMQQGYRQPPPLPPQPQQYNPPRLPQQEHGNYLPPPQQSYNQVPPPPPQQGYNQVPVPQKPIAPPVPQRPPPPGVLYSTPNSPPIPQLEMRPPPQQPSYFEQQASYGAPLQPAQNQMYIQRPQQQFGLVQPTGQQGYQQNVVDSSSQQTFPQLDIRIPTQARQPDKMSITVPAGEYSQQSITNVQVLRTEFQPKPSLLPSPPTIPFSRPVQDTTAEPSSKPEVEYVKTPHLQSLNEENERPTERSQPSTESPSLPASGGGRWEIVPATQYDITHLFNKNKAPGQSEYKEQSQPTRKRPLPIPVPVPISESHVANSVAPVFVVGHHRPSSGPSADEQQRLQQQQDQDNGVLYQPVQLETTIYTTGSAPNPNNVPHQSQFDPLPPSVVRALYNSQRTSFLTHQHLTPSESGSNRDHSSPVYVNSVTVSQAPEETRNVEGAESQYDNKLVSVQQIIDSPEVQYNVHPQESNSEQDQTVVNCNNSPQWVIPNIGRNPTYVHQHTHTVDAQHEQQQQTVNKPYVYYYPSPMSSVYWVEKSTDSSNQQQQQQQQQVNYGSRVPVTTILQQQYASESDANDAAQQAKFSTPYHKLSTIVSPASSNSIGDNSHSEQSLAYENYSFQQSSHGAKNVEHDKNTAAQMMEDDESDEGGSPSIIQQVSTSAPYDILSFAKDPVFDAQNLEDTAEADAYDSSSTTSSEFTSTPSYYNEQDQFDTTSSRAEFKPSVYKTFSSIINSQPAPAGVSSTSSPYYFIQQHHQTSDESQRANNNGNIYKLKLPKFAIDDSSFRVVYDTKENNDIVGPTTLAECFTTEQAVASTTDTPTSTDIYAAGTSTVGYDDFTNYDVGSTTFNPYRVNTQNKIRLHASSRFPSGRPSVTTPTFETTTVLPIPTTADISTHDASPASASVHVPIYRPAVPTQGEFSQDGLKSPNLLSLEDIYKSNEMKTLGQESSTDQSVSVSVSSDEEDEKTKEEPPSPPFSRISTTSRKVPAFIPSKQILNQVEREPIIVESVPVAQSSDQVQNVNKSADSPNMSTKIVKTVRVRQRMRAGTASGVFRARLAAGGQGPSRIKVVQRPASQDYIKNFPEYAIPEGDTLGEDEQTEVKNALIEIKKVK